MDPNAALLSLLCGHMMADHAEALSEWIRGGGFLPDAVLAPVDCAEYIAKHCERTYGHSRYLLGIEFTANERGIWSSSKRERDIGDRMLVATYEHLAEMRDTEDNDVEEIDDCEEY